LAVRHRPTERNGASRAMLSELGFSPDGDGAEQLWRRDVTRAFADADIAALSADIPVAAL
jgi:hypothetical protein